jgi:hypothetical protein
MNARDIWNDYRARATLAVETPHEIALQKYGFVCGLVRGLGGMALGQKPWDMLDGARELIEEAERDICLEIDRRRGMPPVESEN